MSAADPSGNTSAQSAALSITTATAACTCDGGGSCFYNQTPPGPIYGTVGEVVLTPNSPTGSFAAAIIGPGSGNHDGTWYDLNLSAFTSGGTITIAGVSSQCAASSYLVSECFVEPATGNFTAIRNDSDVPAGTHWSFSYQFSAVPVLHLGTECNWGTAAGATGTNAITVSVSP